MERHAAGRAYTYTVQDPLGTESLGCVYVFPTHATFLAKASWCGGPGIDHSWQAEDDSVVIT